MLDIQSPLSFLNENQGLPEKIYGTYVHQDFIYAGTEQGLYWKSLKRTEGLFKQVEGINSLAMNFFVHEENLYCTTAYGYFLIEDSLAVRSDLNHKGVWMLDRQSKDSKYILAGTQAGIDVLKPADNGLTYSHNLEGFDVEAQFISVDKKGYIWVSQPSSGIYRLTVNSACTDVIETRFFGEEDGLPSAIGNYVLKDETDRPVFSTDKGLYRYNYEQESFDPIESFNKQLAYGFGFIAKKIDELGNVYFIEGDGSWAFMRKDGSSYRPDYQSLAPLRGLSSGETGMFFYGSEVLLPTYDGIICFNHEEQYRPAEFRALIRRVSSTDADSVLFNGTFTDSFNEILDYQNKNNLPTLDYIHNGLRFQYSSNLFEYPHLQQFQYQLEGFDKDWSSWSSEARKDYTNLPPKGKYVFRVRAKSVYGLYSEEATYSFALIPPWYRTKWSYTLYAVLIIVFLYLLLHLNSKRLREINEELEMKVQLRTKEIEAKNKELETFTHQLENIVKKRTNKIQQQNNKIREYAFSNSHLVRAPVAKILGILQLMGTSELDEETTEKMKQHLALSAQEMDEILRKMAEILSEETLD